ncbi:MAG: HEAT repeat domain-containing protein [Planctomycetota bacterium]
MTRTPITWIVLALLFTAETVFGAEPEPAPRELQVARTLLISLTAERSAEKELVVRKLVERGPPIVPALLLAGRKLRKLEHLDAIVSALGRLDTAARQKYLLEYVGRQGSDRETCAAWLHLADVGDAQAIPRVVALLNGIPPYVKRSAERAFTRILVRHDTRDTWARVEAGLDTLSDDARCRAALSIGESDSGLGLELLARLLGRWPGIDHALVSAIAQMPEAGRGEEIAPRLRPYLRSRDPGLRRESIMALAMFGDVESAATLIEGLSDEDRGIKGNSHWALAQLSGLKFPESPERWKLWHADETAWWEAEGEDLLDVLTTGTDLQIIEALKVIAGHRLYRMKFSPLLRKLLEHPSPEVRDAAEQALVDLGLTEGSSAPDAGTALAAHGFESITAEEYQRAKTERADAAPASRSGGSWILPAVGLIVLILLLGRLFGPVLLQGLGRIWGGGAQPHGPIVLRVDREKGRASP